MNVFTYVFTSTFETFTIGIYIVYRSTLNAVPGTCAYVANLSAVVTMTTCPVVAELAARDEIVALALKPTPTRFCYGGSSTH